MEVTFTKSPPPPALDWKTGKPLRAAPAGEPAEPAEAPAQPQADQPVPEAAPEPVFEDAPEQTKGLYRAMGWGEAPRKRVEDMTAAPAAPEAPASGAPAAPAEPPAEPEIPEPAELTPQEIASLTARETAREVAKVLQPAQPAAPAAPPPAAVPDMNDDDKRDLEVIKYLELTNPRYKGMSQAYTDYVQKHYAYVNDWMEKNPDKEFNPEDDEHAAWYAANQPNIDPAEIEQGRIDMAAEAKVQERLKPIEEERRKERQEKALEKAGSTIVQQIDRKILRFVESVSPELAAHVKDAKGNPILTAENVEKIDAANPIAKEVMDDVVKNQLEPLLFELEKTTVPELGYRLSPKNNPAHNLIFEFLSKKERDMQSAPPGAKVDAKGRQWMSVSEYTGQLNAIHSDSRLSQSQKEAHIESLDRTVWVITADMLEDLMVDFYGKKAKAEVERREAVARRRFGVAGPAAPKPGAPAAPRPAPSPAPAAGKPRSPALGGQADVRTSTGVPSDRAKTFAKQATDTMFGS
jgi:hypothetical protein